jgi:iron complex transport system substrate-binding protein
VRQSPSAEDAGASGADSIRYAQGFTVTRHDGYQLVEVKDPWNEQGYLQRYILVDRNRAMPQNLPQGTVVRVPVKKIAVFTSVHCAALDELGVADDITGVCESRYMMNIPSIQARLKEGTTCDLGESTQPNIEKMIATGTEVVLASPFQNDSYGTVEKTGIPILECADYMETDPLGRAEWIRFLGFFVHREAAADSLFAATEKRYLEIKELTGNITSRPTLLTGKKYGSSWYVPSGNSYMARLYEDAGADYIFSYLPGTGSTPLTFESVLDKAIHADYWIFNYNQDQAMTCSMLKSEYDPYCNFDAWKQRRIYGCNTHTSPYYEEVPMHPDYLLRELVAIFHPEILPEYRLRYFSPLEDP